LQDFQQYFDSLNGILVQGSFDNPQQLNEVQSLSLLSEEDIQSLQNLHGTIHISQPETVNHPDMMSSDEGDYEYQF